MTGIAVDVAVLAEAGTVSVAVAAAVRGGSFVAACDDRRGEQECNPNDRSDNYENARAAGWSVRRCAAPRTCLSLHADHVPATVPTSKEPRHAAILVRLQTCVQVQHIATRGASLNGGCFRHACGRATEEGAPRTCSSSTRTRPIV